MIWYGAARSGLWCECARLRLPCPLELLAHVLPQQGARLIPRGLAHAVCCASHHCLVPLLTADALMLPCCVVCVRYYDEKMQAPPGQQDKIIREIVAAYVEGLCWVMRYYYEGVASWEW